MSENELLSDRYIYISCNKKRNELEMLKLIAEILAAPQAVRTKLALNYSADEKEEEQEWHRQVKNITRTLTKLPELHRMLLRENVPTK